ncbi:putative bifunctional diguanylate cyclase/phosphodiesterase [Leucobacter musarum]|uniref:putative bifunctional diguanylate cyclase/phosphodiesterase n=1 Tax=Leucobacter musarum TaxID=1930747 RepID=UPI0006A7D2A1|nr:GGDEF domain-containing phosphodiesterase [Leucobacter musarum]
MQGDAEMFRFLVEAVQDYSIYLLSTEGVVTSWNTGAERIKGYRPDEIIGKSFEAFFTGEDRADGLPDRILSEAIREGRFETEGWRVRKDGSRFWAHVTVNAVRDDADTVIGFAKITRDVTVAREASNALRRAASTDPLTGMWNRSAFLAELTRWAGDSAPFAVSIIDLNGFKQINDTLGHATGDELLRATADNLHRRTHLGIVTARLGGDEFAAAALAPDEQAVEEFAQGVSAAMREPVRFDGRTRVIPASIGIARFPRDASDISELLVRADAAMYDAKERSDDRAMLYRDGLLEHSASRRFLGRQILGAIARGEFTLQYQPQSSLKDEAVVGWEALIRWEHPILGLLNPGEFIPLAEANGTIVQLGEWVVRRACQDAARWRDDARVAVNVSASQLTDRTFVDVVTRALAESGLEPRNLELEITESTMISHRREVIETFAELQQLGVLIALDDFGTGFSSLDTLLSFGFDRVKIDRSVLYESLQPSRTRDVLRAILALGHALTATVLVEGVETEQQREILRHEGFDEIQGFLTGRPGAGPVVVSRELPGHSGGAGGGLDDGTDSAATPLNRCDRYGCAALVGAHGCLSEIARQCIGEVAQ